MQVKNKNISLWEAVSTLGKLAQKNGNFEKTSKDSWVMMGFVQFTPKRSNMKKPINCCEYKRDKSQEVI